MPGGIQNSSTLVRGLRELVESSIYIYTYLFTNVYVYIYIYILQFWESVAFSQVYPTTVCYGT